MAFCIKCGTQLADDANFCARCGAPVQKEAVGIIVDVNKGNESYGESLRDTFANVISKSGEFTAALDFEKFYITEYPKEEAQNTAQMKSGGAYYEVTARLAKRFGIRYACLFTVNAGNDFSDISVAIYDANDDTSCQVMNTMSQGSQITNADLEKFLSSIVTSLLDNTA